MSNWSFRPSIPIGKSFRRTPIRIEHLLRYAVLTLLTLPRTDMRDILRLYLDREFRRMVISRLDDPQLLQFWTEEYPAMNYKNAADGLAPIANKLGAFLAHPVVRKAVCKPDQPLRLRQIMDERGQLIVNLSKGRLGGDMANLLGGLIVSNLASAAFSRHDAAPETRRPFMAYIDEFHAITTDAIGDVLSESRKYGLGLTLSHQHTQQTSPEVLASVMGNVGSLLKLTDFLIDGNVDQNTYAERRAALVSEINCLEQESVKIRELAVSQEDVEEFFELMKTLKNLYISGAGSEKRRIVENCFSNRTWV